jgi:hypothetical protein
MKFNRPATKNAKLHNDFPARLGGWVEVGATL